MNVKFLMSHFRKNPVRDKVIAKKWIYSERNTLHRQGGAIRRGECGPEMWYKVSFYWLGNFIG